MKHSIRDVRRGRRLAALLAAVGALAATAIAVSPAQAAFTTSRCEGSAISGQGATFPNVAHNSLWIPFTWPAYCLDVTGTPPGVTYNPDATLSGSGAGRRTFGERSGTGGVYPNNADGSNSRKYPNRFAGTDEVFSAANQTNMNNGSDAVGDEGVVHTIPVAVGANAVLVNLPNGCSVTRKPGTATDFATADGTAANNFSAAEQLQFSDFGNVDRARLQLTRTQLEGLFYGSITTWGALIPWINDGNGTAGEPSDTACADKPIYRVVRTDSSGTTFAQKEWLSSIDTGHWNALLSQNTVWPNDGTNGATKIVRGGTATINPDGSLATGTLANGNGPVVKSTEAIDGSVAYAVLADARTASVTIGQFERQAGVGDDRYWTKVQSKGAAGTNAGDFADPNSVATGFLAGSYLDATKRGANCANSPAANIPTGSDPTLANWLAVTSAETGPYGGCTLTYALAWDDYALPYRLTPGYDPVAEEKKARSVKDYLTAVTSIGQTSLTQQDYSPLPAAIRTIAQAGVAAIGWDKAGDAGGGGGNGGGGNGGGGGGNGGTTGGSGGTNGTPAPSAPSNQFTLNAPRTKGTSIVLGLNVPGAGSVRVTGRAKVGRKTVQVTSGASSRTSGGPVAITLRLSKAALAQLKKKGSLKVSLTTVYTPNGGQSATRTSSVTLKVKKAKRK